MSTRRPQACNAAGRLYNKPDFTKIMVTQSFLFPQFYSTLTVQRRRHGVAVVEFSSLAELIAGVQG
jgi:hypothetical protein